MGRSPGVTLRMAARTATSMLMLPSLMAQSSSVQMAPRALISSAMAASVPALTDIMIMTAATPMMMPSIVRTERSLFAARALSAI